LVARTEKLLQEVKRECMDLGLDEGKILLCQGDVTSTTDLLSIGHKLESGKLEGMYIARADQQNGKESIQSTSSRAYHPPRPSST
jgi:hypothetical protein